MKKFLLLIIIFLLSLSLGAQTGDLKSVPSVEWQKVDLQEKIVSKVKYALSSMLKQNEFLVDVEIAVSTPEKPNFSKRKPANEEEKKPRVRFSNVSPKNAPKDYLVFSKLGLEAPVADDWEEKNKEDENKNKDEKSEFEQLWKYNEAIDIFKNIESVKIYLYLADSLSSDAIQTAKTIVQGIKFNIPEVNPSFEFGSIKMPKAEEESWLDRAARFSTMIGLIVSVIILGILALVLFNQYKEMMESRPANGAQPANNKGEKDSDEKEEKESEAMMKIKENPLSGMNRFRLFLLNTPLEAGLLVKSWINSEENPMAIKALNALVQYFETDDLYKIFSVLTTEERNKWKMKLGNKLEDSEFEEVDGFISSQIINEIIVPRSVEDPEVYNLILGLKPDNAVAFVRENPELGRVLLNVMSVKFVSKIFEQMGQAEIDKLLEDSIGFDSKTVPQYMEQLKTTLANYQTMVAVNPFVEKVVGLISVVSPDKETALFRTLLKAGEEDALKRLALEYFPAELFSSLPLSLLKAVFSDYPNKKKLEYVALQEEQTKRLYLDAFAPEGSSMREMFNIDLERINSEAGVYQQIELRKTEIVKDFLGHARQIIKKDTAHSQELKDLLETWVKELNRSSFENKSKMKLAA